MPPRASQQLIGDGKETFPSRVNRSRPVATGRTRGVWDSVSQNLTEPPDVHVSQGNFLCGAMVALDFPNRSSGSIPDEDPKRKDASRTVTKMA